MYLQPPIYSRSKYFHLFNLVWFFFSILATSQQLPSPVKEDSILKSDLTLKKKNDAKSLKFNGHDGPYIVNDRLYRIDAENNLTISSKFNSDSILVQTNNKISDSFYIKLEKNYRVPKTNYEFPEKLIMISDIEGNYNGFSSFLKANGVIDSNHNWIYGDGHLMLVGDFVDRGKNVTQVLWLIYKLEHQAQSKKGKVHFILGNHEILNFKGDHKYNRGKYIKAAQIISSKKNKKEAIKFIYSKKTELGKWLATKNVIEKIGDYIFVHGGLSPALLDFDLDLETINTLARSRFSTVKPSFDRKIRFIYSAKGPFWYRGLVMNRLNYKKMKTEELECVLDNYNAKKIVIGHTPVNNISTDYNGAVIMLDIHHGTTKFSGQTKGLLIEKGLTFIVNDLGDKKLFKN